MPLSGKQHTFIGRTVQGKYITNAFVYKVVFEGTTIPELDGEYIRINNDPNSIFNQVGGGGSTLQINGSEPPLYLPYLAYINPNPYFQEIAFCYDPNFVNWSIWNPAISQFQNYEAQTFYALIP